MPLNSKQNQVDGWVNARWPEFQNKQASWMASKGEYFQGLLSHKNRIVGDATAAPDNLDSKPTDRTADWNAFPAQVPPINLPASMPAALVMNVYKAATASGWGYALVATFDYGTAPVKRYTKAWRFGPEPRSAKEPGS